MKPKFPQAQGIFVYPYTFGSKFIQEIDIWQK